jgi:hypothetical protein
MVMCGASIENGRTIPSFRNVLAMSKADWKSFRNALDKSETKEFDDMFDIPRLYLSACSNSVQLVPLHPIVMSILFHHYKELTQLLSEVEQIEMTRVKSSKKKKELTIEGGGGGGGEEWSLQSKLFDF